MIEFERFDESVGIDIDQLVIGDIAEGFDQLRTVALLDGIAVRFVFLTAADIVHVYREEPEHRRHHILRGIGGQHRIAHGKAEGGIEIRFQRRKPGAVLYGEYAGKKPQSIDAVGKIVAEIPFVLEMTSLMGEHRKQFALAVFIQEVVGDSDRTKQKQLHHKGVFGSALLRLVIDLDPLHLMTAAFQQGFDLSAKIPFRKIREVISHP